MEISGRRFGALLLATILTAFVLGVYADDLMVFVNSQHQDMKPAANVYVTIQTPMGVQSYLIGNLITDIGENATMYGCAGVAVDVKYIALGNCSVSQTKTKLDSEATTAGAGRALATRTFWISGGDYAFNLTKKFTFTGTITLNATAAHWSGTANAADAYAIANIPETTFQNNWNLTITWMFVYNGN